MVVIGGLVGGDGEIISNMKASLGSALVSEKNQGSGFTKRRK